MLYDQAQLSVAYSHAYQATKDEKFSAIVEDILTYVKRDLGHPLGAFYSAEDADSKVWYFSVWNFKTRYTKFDSPLGKNIWNLNYFFQYWVIEESRASEVVKTKSL